MIGSEHFEQMIESDFVSLVCKHELGPRRDTSGNWEAGELNNTFRELADTWCKRNDKSNAELAAHLSSASPDSKRVRPQSCSQWKYGTAGRKPTFSAIAMLVTDLNMQLVLDSDGMRVIRRRTRR